MKWEDLAKKLAVVGLDVIGAAVPGSSIVTGALASMLGTNNTPDAIDAALAVATPDKFAELKQFQIEKETELKGIISTNQTQQITVVNNTIQKETTSEKWWVSGWRPFWGFTSAFAFLFVCFLVCSLMWKAVVEGNSNAMAMIPAIIASFTSLFAVPGAILGITAWHRGKAQIEQIKQNGANNDQ